LDFRQLHPQVRTLRIRPGWPLRAIVNREQHEAAPAELRRWVWAGGRKHTGLVRRRNEKAELYVG
jgi:GH24 family phage-related lysozyme (muramidase)